LILGQWPLRSSLSLRLRVGGSVVCAFLYLRDSLGQTYPAAFEKCLTTAVRGCPDAAASCVAGTSYRLDSAALLAYPAVRTGAELAKAA